MKIRDLLENPEIPKSAEEHKRPQALLNALKTIEKIRSGIVDNRGWGATIKGEDLPEFKAAFPEGLPSSELFDVVKIDRDFNHKKAFALAKKIRSMYSGYGDTGKLQWLKALRLAMLNS